MTEQEILLFIENITQLAFDNDKRNGNDIQPCVLNSTKWTNKDIDNLPEDFDWQLFWYTCKKYYPLHSVAGGYMCNSEETIKEIEYNRMPINDLMGCIDKPKGKKVLEIGYGYGGAAKRFHEYGFKYTGIDYVSSGDIKKEKKYGKFIEIDKSGIPESLFVYNSFDLVFSTNTFQHLTRQQRIEYYKQIYEVLNTNGVFCFDLFTRNEAELEKFYAKEENKDNAYACNFFQVHTSVPSLCDVLDVLQKIGFKIEKVNNHLLEDTRTFWTTFIVKK